MTLTELEKLEFDVSPAERDLILTAAEVAGMSLQEFISWAIHASSKAVIDDFESTPK